MYSFNVGFISQKVFHLAVVNYIVFIVSKYFFFFIEPSAFLLVLYAVLR